MTDYGPKEGERLSCGVLAIRILKTSDSSGGSADREVVMLVGAGDGTVVIIKKVNKKYKISA